MESKPEFPAGAVESNDEPVLEDDDGTPSPLVAPLPTDPATIDMGK